jgi:hypothetical protein
MKYPALVVLLAVLGACSQQAPETGNGPGPADGAGRAPDPASEAAASPAAESQGAVDPQPPPSDNAPPNSSEAQSVK